MTGRLRVGGDVRVLLERQDDAGRRSTTCSPRSAATTTTEPMPELPEIQAHAERLTDDFGGRELSAVPSPIAFTALKTFAPSPDDGRRAIPSSASGAAASTCCSTSATSPSSCT